MLPSNNVKLRLITSISPQKTPIFPAYNLFRKIVSSCFSFSTRSKTLFCGPEQRQYAEIHIIIFLIVLYLFGKRRQNFIWIRSWLMLAGLCFLENRSSLQEVTLNWSSVQTSKRCEISFFSSTTTIGEELRTSETSQDVYTIGFYVLLVYKLWIQISKLKNIIINRQKRYIIAVQIHQ